MYVACTSGPFRKAQYSRPTQITVLARSVCSLASPPPGRIVAAHADTRRILSVAGTRRRRSGRCKRTQAEAYARAKPSQRARREKPLLLSPIPLSLPPLHREKSRPTRHATRGTRAPDPAPRRARQVFDDFPVREGVGGSEEEEVTRGGGRREEEEGQIWGQIWQAERWGCGRGEGGGLGGRRGGREEGRTAGGSGPGGGGCSRPWRSPGPRPSASPSPPCSSPRSASRFSRSPLTRFAIALLCLLHIGADSDTIMSQLFFYLTKRMCNIGSVVQLSRTPKCSFVCGRDWMHSPVDDCHTELTVGCYVTLSPCRRAGLKSWPKFIKYERLRHLVILEF